MWKGRVGVVKQRGNTVRFMFRAEADPPLLTAEQAYAWKTARDRRELVQPSGERPGVQ